MIEFNAPCGHSLRVEDDTAGEKIRCAYCGREAVVPYPFGERMVEVQPADLAAMAQVEVSAESPLPRRVPIDPAARVPEPRVSTAAWLVMAVGGSGLIVFVAMAAWFAQPRPARVPAPTSGQDQATVATTGDRSGRPEPAVADHRADQPPETASHTPAREQPGTVFPHRGSPPVAAPAAPRGLLAARLPANRSGVYIESVGVEVQCHLIALDDVHDDWIASGGHLLSGAGVHALPADSYRVAITVDRRALSDWPEILDAFDNNDIVDVVRRQAVDSAVMIEKLDDRLVRQYDIEVQRQAWTLLTAWFRPQDRPLPATAPRYGLDEQDVMGELTYYEIDSDTRADLLTLLAHAGQIAQPLADGTMRLFGIDLLDGRIHSRDLEPAVVLEVPEDATASSTPTLTAADAAAAPLRPPPAIKSGHPWGVPWGVTMQPRAKRLTLVQMVAELRRSDDTQVHRRLLEACCPRGASHDEWLAGTRQTRLTFVGAVDDGAMQILCSEVGALLLVEAELAVRLALLDRFVSLDNPCILATIDRRIAALEAQPATAAVRRELAALAAARRQLATPSRGNRHNPWAR